VRRGCILGDGGVVAHAAICAQSARHAWSSRWHARSRRRGERDQLHRRKVGSGYLWLSCEDRPAAGRPRLSLRGIPRRRCAGVRDVPNRPRGRARFTFTSFRDQATPTLGWKYRPPEGLTIANPPYVNDNLGSPAAADTVLGVERLQPLFHLLNGDLL